MIIYNLLQLTTGRDPCHGMGDTRAELAEKVINGVFPPRPTGQDVIARGLTDAVWNLAEDCWSFNPNARPTATEVLRRLQEELMAHSS